MANISPVVGDVYVAPEDTQLSVARKLLSLQDGNFTITDSEGNTLFLLKEKLVSLTDKKTLFDGSDNPVLSLQKKTFTLHSTHEVYAGETSDLLFEVKTSSIRGDVSYDVFIAGSEAATYVVKGDFDHRAYSIIYNDEFVVADVSKAHFNVASLFGEGKHQYGVKVKAGVDLAFIAAVVTIIDSIHSEVDSDDD